MRCRWWAQGESVAHGVLVVVCGVLVCVPGAWCLVCVCVCVCVCICEHFVCCASVRGGVW